MSSLYSSLKQRDLLAWCNDLLKSGFIYIRDVDGKLDFGPQASIAWDTPWHFTVSRGNLNCGLWSKIMFKVIFPNVPPSLLKNRVWVPSPCQSCWKVVSRPNNVKQLFATVELQKRLGWQAKCGIEHRQHVFGLYGAYWYSRSIEEGLKCYELVRKAHDEDPLLGPDVKVILKRSCTEMEFLGGPSDKYEVSPEQAYVENLVYENFNTDIINRKQSQSNIDYVHAKWIEFAYQWGDETVYEFLDPENPPYPQVVTYHHLLQENQPGEKVNDGQEPLSPPESK